MQEARDKKDKEQQRENRRKANRGRGQETKQRPRIGEPRRSFISIHTQPPIARPLAAPYVINDISGLGSWGGFEIPILPTSRPAGRPADRPTSRPADRPTVPPGFRGT